MGGDAPLKSRVVEFFDRQAEGWSTGYRPGGSMEGRVARFTEAVRRRVPAGARVMDVGCGTGEIAIGLAKAGFTVSAGDISSGMLESARRKDGDGAVDWMLLPQGPGVSVPREDASFDLVLSSSVLEYVADPLRALREIARVLVPRGWVLFSVPDMRDRGRHREGIFRDALRIPGARAVASRTRLAAYARYLELSVNRMPLGEWHALCRTAGMQPEAEPPCDGPLALIEARRGD